jgi:hypothetical protein
MYKPHLSSSEQILSGTSSSSTQVLRLCREIRVQALGFLVPLYRLIVARFPIDKSITKSDRKNITSPLTQVPVSRRVLVGRGIPLQRFEMRTIMLNLNVFITIPVQPVPEETELKVPITFSYSLGSQIKLQSVFRNFRCGAGERVREGGGQIAPLRSFGHLVHPSRNGS